MDKQRDSAFIEQHTASCANCVLPGLCLRAGLSPQDVERLDRLVYTRRHVRHGEELYRAGDPFSSIYAIRSGFFKNVLILETGRSQIMGFYMPGEIMGVDGIAKGVYPTNAVALADAQVCAIPLARVDEISNDLRDLAHRVHQIMSLEIAHDRQVMALLGGTSAEARLAAFLIDVARRFAARGYDASNFELPMTRQDIGSYLGLKLETVSRMFSRLQEEELIEVHQRQIRVLDAAGLQKLL